MAEIIDLKTFTDTRGNLTVVEKVFPFEIRRIFYIYGVDKSVRGYHRHKKTIQAAVCLTGSCRVFSQSGNKLPIKQFTLNKPSKCLIIQPEDFHWMNSFSKDAILMVFASEFFDKSDYIFESYEK